MPASRVDRHLSFAWPAHRKLAEREEFEPKLIRENTTAAVRLKLSAQQIERLNNLTPAAGERHDEGNMAVIDR